MSRLTELVRRVEKQNPALAQELAQEIKTLTARRSFGLNFERHLPESVELPERTIRRGDKVRFRAPRGATGTESDERIWRVTRIEGRGETRTAHLVEYQGSGEPERGTRLVADLVMIAEFRDPIYPGLRPTGKVERGGNKPYHAVINGENYHALEALLFAYEGKVDCIYIDPPYNTRDKDWKYNNDYVDSDDAYRHSKWLAMMERRLSLAKRLLNPDNSMLIATIDEKEYLRLGLLLEQVFPGRRIQMISSMINPSGVARGKEFYRVDEYIFFVYIGGAVISDAYVEGICITELSEEDDAEIPKVRWESLLRSGTGARRAESALKFYPVYVDPVAGAIVKVGDTLPLDQHPEDVDVPEDLIAVWPIRQDGSEGRWQLSRRTLLQLLEQGFAKIGNINQRRRKVTLYYLPTGLRKKVKDGEVVVTGKDQYGGIELAYTSAKALSARPKTQWSAKSHSATDYGSSLLPRFLPSRRFPFPKSLYAVEDTLRFFVRDKPNALILDFFSGSGTTAHAVMRLNRQDGGCRRSIMVTNNEVSAGEAIELRSQGHRPGDPEWEVLGISKFITQPRIEAAITGRTPSGSEVRGDYAFTDKFPMSEGFAENAEFFDLTYEDPERIRHELAFAAIAPLLWMKAGSEGPRIEAPTDTFAITETYAVLFNLDAAAEFVQAVVETEHLRVAYIVTDDERQYQIVADALPQRVQTVRLYEAYLRTFQVSGGED